MEQFIGLLGDSKRPRTVKFEFQDARSVCTMTAEAAGQKMTAVLMPIRGDK